MWYRRRRAGKDMAKTFEWHFCITFVCFCHFSQSIDSNGCGKLCLCLRMRKTFWQCTLQETLLSSCATAVPKWIGCEAQNCHCGCSLTFIAELHAGFSLQDQMKQTRCAWRSFRVIPTSNIVRPSRPSSSKFWQFWIATGSTECTEKIGDRAGTRSHVVLLASLPLISKMLSKISKCCLQCPLSALRWRPALGVPDTFSAASERYFERGP